VLATMAAAYLILLAGLGLLFTATPATFGQDINASLSGMVTDPNNGAIPGAKLTLTNEDTGFQSNFISNDAGEYTFRNLTPGKYDLVVTAANFKSESKKGIELAVNQVARVDIHLSIGKADETVTVSADTSLINYENASLEGGVSPEVLQDFPLVVSGAPRSAVAVATMMPGVTSGGGDSAYNVRINGGMVTGDEAIVDGVTADEGYMGQSGMVALWSDFGMSPDITSEVHVLTANYDAQYGNTTSGQLIVQTKSGGEKFHGGGYEYIRNDLFNAIQYGGTHKPPDKENDYGAYIGGPWYIPGFHGDKSFLKGYFYFNWEAFKDHGGANSTTDSIATTAERTGNFTQVPTQLYYPNDPTKYGADAGKAIQYGGTANMMNPAYEDSTAKAWMAALPTPTNSNLIGNYEIPVSGQLSLTSSENVYFWRADLNVGAKDHLYYTWWWQYSGVNTASDLPVALSSAHPASPENAPIIRLNWEHTLNYNMTNHASFGYLNRNEGYFQADHASTLPKVPGVASTEDMPTMTFGASTTSNNSANDYSTLGNDEPANSHNDVTTRGTLAFNDVFTVVHGRHTIKLGYEWRHIGTSIHNGINRGGTFNFTENTTGNTGCAPPAAPATRWPPSIWAQSVPPQPPTTTSRQNILASWAMLFMPAMRGA
jgi:hypothetical protein